MEETRRTANRATGAARDLVNLVAMSWTVLVRARAGGGDTRGGVRFVSVATLSSYKHRTSRDDTFSRTLQKLFAPVGMFQRPDLIEAGRPNGRCLLSTWIYQMLEA